MANEVNMGAYTPSCLPGPFPPGEPFPRIPGKPWVPDPTTPRIPVGQSGASGIIEGIISIAFAIFGSIQPQADVTRELPATIGGHNGANTKGISPALYCVPSDSRYPKMPPSTTPHPPPPQGKCNIL